MGFKGDKSAMGTINRPHRHSVNVLLEEERPSQGRPQGSHPLILTTPAHTKTRIGHCPLRSLCKGGCRVVRSGDPCGQYSANKKNDKIEKVIVRIEKRNR